MDGVARRRADKQLLTRDIMKKTTTEHTEGETTKGDFCRPPNDSKSLAESFTKTTVCENDNLEMIGQCQVEPKFVTHGDNSEKAKDR